MIKPKALIAAASIIVAVCGPLFAQQAHGSRQADLWNVLQLAETISGPGQFAFPLFAPIDLGGGYEDTIAPIVIARLPAANEVDVPVDTSIQITLADWGTGVDESSVRLFLNQQRVFPTVLSGTDKTVDVSFSSSQPFDFAERVEVAVTAADLAQNVMPQDVFTFTTNTDATPRPTVSISTNKSVYTEGQILVVLASVRNPTQRSFHVMAFVAVEIQGAYYFYPTFEPAPVGIELRLPPGFTMRPVAILSQPLVDIPEGKFTWYAALMDVQTGTLGQVSCAQCEFVAPR